MASVDPDLRTLYGRMLRVRLVEEAIGTLWRDGFVSGEMHLGTGEEGINVGIMAHVREGDALALDHRGTAPLLLRGVDPALVIRELLGREDGLCGGMGGHMHLFSRPHLAASSGIVGASGPAAVGFALAGARLRPGTVAVAFFGEGALNQGMMMEALNLACVWSLPVVFVCKDDDWSITTESGRMTAGGPSGRARAFGLPVFETDGRDVISVRDTAADAFERARSGGGPIFVHARCVHLEGHFMGYQLMRAVRHPVREMPAIAAPLAAAFLGRHGSALRERVRGMRSVLASVVATVRDEREDEENDPVVRARRRLGDGVDPLEDDIAADVQRLVADLLTEAES